MCQSVSQSSFCLSVCLPVCMSRGTLASIVAGQLVIYISGSTFWSTYQSSRNYSLRHRQMFFSLTGNKPFHWYYLGSTIFVHVCVCVRQHRPISRMWSTEMAVVGRQWRGNSWCGHNWVTGSVCNLHTSPPSRLSLSLLSPFCQGERWHLLWGEADSSHAHQSQCHSPSRHH